jgi:NADH-quinone oxidoreductase subunit C
VAEPPNSLPAAGDAASPVRVDTLRALGEAVRVVLPAGIVETILLERGGSELALRVRRDALPQVMTLLRDDQRFAFEQCMDLCGVDWPERPERFDVVYNLLSLSLNQRIRVIVRTDAATPVPSLASLWPCLTWYEREAWDMYGIVFEGQSDLRRLLTDYGFQGHPLRKDFPLTGHVEVRYDETRKQVVYEPVTLTQDFRNFDFLSPWEAITTLPGDEKVHRNRIEGPAA